MKLFLNKLNISYWSILLVFLMTLICVIYYYFIKFFNHSIIVEEMIKDSFSERPVISKKIETGGHILTFGQVKKYLDSLKKRSKYREPFLSENEIEIKTALFKSTLPKIQGIIKIGNMWMAIIDGKTVVEGDIIDGYLIKNITSDVVIIKKGKQIYHLTP